jgi:hypothetical protein
MPRKGHTSTPLQRFAKGIIWCGRRNQYGYDNLCGCFVSLETSERFIFWRRTRVGTFQFKSARSYVSGDDLSSKFGYVFRQKSYGFKTVNPGRLGILEDLFGDFTTALLLGKFR